MTTLYKQIEAISDKHNHNPGEIGHLVEWDLEIDKDLITNDTQNGDVWLWIMKGETGSNLTRLVGGFDQEDFLKSTYLREIPKGGRLFWLECTGHNEGHVVETTREDALERLSSFKDNPNRVPRRQTVESVLSEHVERYGSNARSSVVGKEQGDKTFISIKPESRDYYKVTEVFSSKGKEPRIESHFASFSDVKNIGASFISVTVDQKSRTGSYGTVEAITEKQFDKIQKLAIKKLEKKDLEQEHAM